MSLVAVGLNHTTAPLQLREKLAIPPDELGRHLTELMALAGLEEGVLLSTCNRVEIYGVPKTAPDPERLVHSLAELRGVPQEHLSDHCFKRRGSIAARHIFRVAGSLESMVVGEPQILGQVKDAFRVAQEIGTVGAVLDRCMTVAFRAAKRVRSETGIGEGSASISSVAVDLAQSIFGRLKGCRTLILGAGEMSEQSAAHLRAAEVSEIVVINRNDARGRSLAETVGGRYESWDRLEDELKVADIVVSGTGAREPVLRVEAMKRAARARRGRPIFLVDIAVPRDIEPGVADLDQVYLYNIDDLQSIVQQNIEQRIHQAEQATRLVDEEVSSFVDWQRGRQVVPVIRQLQANGEQIAAMEVERTLARLNSLGESEQDAVKQMARAIVQKMLHQPKTSLRSEAQGPQGDALISAAHTLFGLDMPVGTPKGDEQS